jgi:hypothetical protein
VKARTEAKLQYSYHILAHALRTQLIPEQHVI